MLCAGGVRGGAAALSAAGGGRAGSQILVYERCRMPSAGRICSGPAALRAAGGGVLVAMRMVLGLAGAPALAHPQCKYNRR